MAYITVQELASRLKKSPRTITNWVKRGIAHPVNPDTYRRDGRYVFSEDEVNRLQSLFSKLSLQEAANIVGITPQYLNQLAIEGEIESELITYGKQKRRRFNKSDCLLLKEKIEKQEHTRATQKYGKRISTYYNGIRLFELIIYEGEKARIVETNPIRLLKRTGEMTNVDLPNLFSEPWPDIPYQRKKGTIVFKFQMSNNVDDPIYGLLYKMIETLGEKNVQVFQKDGYYTVRCRQGKIVGTGEEYALLQDHVVEERVIRDGDNIILSTSKHPVTVYLPEEIIKEIKRRAKQYNCSFNDVVLDILKNGVNL